MLNIRSILLISCLFILFGCEKTVEEKLVYKSWTSSGRNVQGNPSNNIIPDIFYLGAFKDTSVQYDVLPNCPSNPVQSHYRFQNVTLTFLESNSLVIEANGRKKSDNYNIVSNQHCILDTAFSIFDSTYSWAYNKTLNQVSIYNLDTTVYLDNIYFHGSYSPEEFIFDMNLFVDDSVCVSYYHFW